MCPSRPQTVAAALIVRDEERFLPGCLASLTGLVDEIVVVDTGSQDASVALATAAGARVLHHDWAEDFAAARNLGLDAVRADWVLYIDADERLRLPGPGPLGRWIDPAALAGYVRFSPRQGYTRYREWRLFRRDSRLRFVGSFHETIVPAIRALAAETGLQVVQTAVEIDHLGYEQRNPAKLARNLTMLTALLERDASRVYCWHHLAETLMALGRREAALEAAGRGLALAETATEDDQCAAASLIRQVILRDRIARQEPVAQDIAAALNRFPADHALRLMLAEAELDEGRPEAALGPLGTLLSVDPDALYSGRLAFDRRIFGEAALHAASRACAALGDRAAAARCVALTARGVEQDRAARDWIVARIAGLRQASAAIGA